jgi:hypothetical protein
MPNFADDGRCVRLNSRNAVRADSGKFRDFSCRTPTLTMLLFDTHERYCEERLIVTASNNHYPRFDARVRD